MPDEQPPESIRMCFTVETWWHIVYAMHESTNLREHESANGIASQITGRDSGERVCLDMEGDHLSHAVLGWYVISQGRMEEK